MKIETSASSGPDTRSAMARALAGIEAGPKSLVVAHISSRHDGQVVRQMLKERFGDAAPLHGGTSCLGVMTGAGPEIVGGEGLGLCVFDDPDGDFGVGLAALGDEPRAAAAAAARRALEAAGRVGEAPELIWVTAAPGAEEAIIAGLEDVVGGDVPIVGGSAADNTVSGDWFVFDGDAVVANGVVVTVLFPSTACATAYQSGYAPTRHEGVATKAEGRRLSEIDHRPAREVYAEWTKGAVAPTAPTAPEAILAESTFSPLGRKATEVADVPFYLLAHPATALPDDSLELFADVEEGETLHLMTGGVESLTSRAGRVASRAVDQLQAEPAGALVIYCGGCMLAVQEHMDAVAAGVDAALGGAPFLGVFTFGEQGPVLGAENRHGNLMISCVTFGAA